MTMNRLNAGAIFALLAVAQVLGQNSCTLGPLQGTAANGLVSWWNIADPSSSSLTDAGPGNNTGIPTGSFSTQTGPKTNMNALGFIYGSGSYFTVPVKASWASTSSQTLMAYASVTALSSQATSTILGFGSGNYGINLGATGINTTHVQVSCSFGYGSGVVAYSSVVTAGYFHHFGCAASGRVAVLYMDGRKMAGSSSALPATFSSAARATPLQPALIGSNIANPTSQSFGGRLADIRVYSVYLNVNDYTSVYHAISSAFTCTTTTPPVTRTTGVQTTGIQTTGVQTPAHGTTGVQTTGIQTTSIQTTGPQTTAVRTTAARTTAPRTTGIQTTGVRSTTSSLLPRGNAAWCYDGDGSSGPAMWRSLISEYNRGASSAHKVTTIYTYGGDMEYYPDLSNPYQTYFPPGNQEAAALYKNLSSVGVQYVIATVDGVMNGGDSYDPNLNRLTTAQVKQWADQVAALYCGYDYIDGIQLDLEPFANPYITNLLIFITELREQLQLTSNNCVNTAHPRGRSLGVFMSALVATADVFTALGSNGYVIVSGYDLAGTPAGTPTPIATYTEQLTDSLNAIMQAAGSTGAYIIGIPAAASVHEFTYETTANGNTVQGYPQYSNTTTGYVQTAVSTTHNTVGSESGFLGIALWQFAPKLAYPGGSNNLFYPNTPFSTPGEMHYLQNNL